MTGRQWRCMDGWVSICLQGGGLEALCLTIDVHAAHQLATQQPWMRHVPRPEVCRCMTAHVALSS
jgi:hypothetical protein